MIDSIVVTKRTYGSFNYTVSVGYSFLCFRWTSMWNCVVTPSELHFYHEPTKEPPSRRLRNRLTAAVRAAQAVPCATFSAH